jgi:hypothetical protein
MATGKKQYSLVLAMDYRVHDPEHMLSELQKRQKYLTSIGARAVAVYSSIEQPGRVLVTMGLRSKEPVTAVLRSPAIFEWFDIAGVYDIPAIFAGEIVEKIELSGSSPERAPGVVMAATARVDNAANVVRDVHRARDRFVAAGVLRVWVYQAFDDAQEVMILQGIDDRTSAQRWIEHPGPAADWMRGVKFGGYPSLFVGTLMSVMLIQADR